MHHNPQAETDRVQSCSVARPSKPCGRSPALCKCPSPKSPTRLRFTGGSIQMTGSGLRTVCCLKGRAPCAAPPNQKQPQKSNPAETAQSLQHPLRTNPEKNKIKSPGSFANWKNRDNHRRPIRIANDDSSWPIKGLKGEIGASAAG